MPSNDKYTFKVFADGMALDEYEVEEKENIYSCWIASEAGKNFYIHWTGGDTDAALKCTVSVDGSILRTVVNLAGSAIDCNIKGCLVDANAENLFAFSQVSLTDDETIASPDQNLSDLGSIELCVYRVELTKSAVQSVIKPMGVIESAIHERSKKMSMHRVTLQGTEEFKTPCTFYNSKLLENVPHARFIFKYRPKEFLRAQGMVPEVNTDDSASNAETRSRSNTPAPTNKKRRRDQAAEGENGDEEERRAREILRMRKQMQELQANLNRLENANGPVKREVKSEPFTFLPVDANGVIDLTDD